MQGRQKIRSLYAASAEKLLLTLKSQHLPFPIHDTAGRPNLNEQCHEHAPMVHIWAKAAQAVAINLRTVIRIPPSCHVPEIDEISDLIFKTVPQNPRGMGCLDLALSC